MENGEEGRRDEKGLDPNPAMTYPSLVPSETLASSAADLVEKCPFTEAEQTLLAD